MSIVTVQVAREGSGAGHDFVTSGDNASLITGISQLLLDLLHKPQEAPFVVIEMLNGEFGLGRPRYGWRQKLFFLPRNVRPRKGPAVRRYTWTPTLRTGRR